MQTPWRTRYIERVFLWPAQFLVELRGVSWRGRLNPDLSSKSFCRSILTGVSRNGVSEECLVQVSSKIVSEGFLQSLAEERLQKCSAVL